MPSTNEFPDNVDLPEMPDIQTYVETRTSESVVWIYAFLISVSVGSLVVIWIK